MFDALVNGRIDTGSLRFEVEYHDIEELNRGAGLGRADISKISCAVLPAIAAAAVVYCVLALALGAVTRADVAGLPKGEKIARILHLH